MREIEVRRPAVQRRYRPSVRLHGQRLRRSGAALDLNGKVLAATGKPGKGPGEFGEAHFIAVSPKDELYVADSVNGALVKFVKK